MGFGVQFGVDGGEHGTGEGNGSRHARVWLHRTLSAFDVGGEDLQWIGDRTVCFDVIERDTSDEDDDSVGSGRLGQHG